ncbi:MAG: cytochrome c [Pseudohongiellaceae bacterium]
MNKKYLPLGITLLAILGVMYWVFGLPATGNPEIPVSQAAIDRGGYLINAGGCASCHQVEGAQGLSGGYELEVESPFPSVFRAPNITPDDETGIGGWTGRDFLLSLKHGRSPSGGFYFPAFPYRSYALLRDEDVLDMAAWLMAQEPIRNEVAAHTKPVWLFGWMMAGWNIMADFLEGEYPAVADDPQIQRGAYLARALGHCGECHTPRNGLGMMQLANEFAGVEEVSPPINAEALSNWTENDFIGLLDLGMTASFDFVGGEMADVVEHTSSLTDADREAYAAFFLRDVE